MGGYMGDIMSSFFTFSYNKGDLFRMPARRQSSNKGTYGRVLCVCGSYGMAGAAYLAAKAALRVGAGLVEVLTPECNRTVIHGLLPEAVVTAYDGNCPSKAVIDAALARADAVVCGCGLGVTPESRTVVAYILRNVSVPCVLDADGLNIVAKNPSLKNHLKGKIITPHPAEMARLLGAETEDVCSDLRGVCHDFARNYNTVCVLKDHNTVVSEGTEQIYLNNSGNSGMATGGSGDVLSGILGGILAQNKEGNLTVFEAACLGVYVHGLSGDAARNRLGEYSLIASDIIDSLPEVLRTVPIKD